MSIFSYHNLVMIFFLTCSNFCKSFNKKMMALRERFTWFLRQWLVKCETAFYTILNITQKTKTTYFFPWLIKGKLICLRTFLNVIWILKLHLSNINQVRTCEKPVQYIIFAVDPNNYHFPMCPLNSFHNFLYCLTTHIIYIYILLYFSEYSELVSYCTSGSAPSQPDPPMLSEANVTELIISWIKRPNDDEFVLQMNDEVSVSATYHLTCSSYPNVVLWKCVEYWDFFKQIMNCTVCCKRN